MIELNDFKKASECFYKSELYLVRDNGAVLRKPLDNLRPRPTDNKWTFGKLNISNGYLEIAAQRIHRIVATAFYGDPPTKEHVVDHIDTNKQNNRPENLRWVTRLENILLNPITAKRIELVCGSVEAFLEDPSKFRDKFPEPNYKWMAIVSIEEAQASKERLLAWAQSDKQLKGETLEDWIYNRNRASRDIKGVEIISGKAHIVTDEMIESMFARVELETGLTRSELSSKSKKEKYYLARIKVAKLLRSELGLSDEGIGDLIGRSPSTVGSYLRTNDYTYRKQNTDNILASAIIQHYELDTFGNETIKSLTANAVQKNWKTPCEFPCCPQEIINPPIMTYFKNLEQGGVFSQNKYSKSIVEKFAISEDKSIFWVMCKSSDDNAMKPYSLSEVKFENSCFVHNSLGSFFGKDGAEKQLIIAQGLKWTGGATLDDMC
jgi:predicted transcriptional regulator